ncbi:MAG: flagellar motor switch protein FliG [Deltaproteobacteria bacterium]|nr:MAG: flagellar motor switch protein FliG [Deltaproteobacteria bacterium]
MATSSKMDGIKKAAILLMTMGDNFMKEVFKGLSDNEIELLGKSMSGLESVTVPIATVNEVMDEFKKKCSEISGITGKGVEAIKNTLIEALGEERARPIMETISLASDKSAFSTLRQVDTSILVDYLKGEHPQTIALVLAHLEYSKAAQVLANMPENLQSEIVLRITNLGMVPSEVIDELDDVLRKEIKSMGSTDSKKLGGVEAVAEIMNQLDTNTENNIFSSLEEVDADLAEQIREKMFVFEDIINIDNRGIQAILKEITNEDLILALKTASEPLKEKILSNMSSRASEMLMEDMEAMGPVKLSDVESAQQSIVRVVRKLEAAGKIVIGGKGGGDVLV